jgi:hypothetical protein
LVVEAARNDLAVGVAQELGHGVDHGDEHGLRVLLDPSGAGVGQWLVAPGLGHAAQVLVVEHRLDGRGPLVDAEQEAAHVLTRPKGRVNVAASRIGRIIAPSGWANRRRLRRGNNRRRRGNRGTWTPA